MKCICFFRLKDYIYKKISIYKFSLTYFPVLEVSTFILKQYFKGLLTYSGKNPNLSSQ